MHSGGFTSEQMGFYPLYRDRWVIAMSLHTTQQPAQWEWNAYEQELRALFERVQRDASRVIQLVISDGAHPTAKQRRSMYEGIFERQPVRLTVVSCALTNPAIRGVATALTWLNPRSTFHPPERYPEALDTLALEPHAADIWRVWCGLQRSVPRVRSLERAAALLSLPLNDPGSASFAPLRLSRPVDPSSGGMT